MILRDKDKERLVAIFKSVGLPLEVWAYGSRVSGTAHSGSDLDLVVFNKNQDSLPPGILQELRYKIRESNIPILVQLFDWAQLPQSFHRNIEAQHEVLFSSLSSIAEEPENGYSNKGENRQSDSED
ncbi:MAG: nucleotidyltransferase domain-containing protein [Flavobacteriales bacterium]|nr:nucleotidyltransferase domain-containing protein [Flavobacteriales bacterium]